MQASFDGQTYDHQRDGDRLHRQLEEREQDTRPECARTGCPHKSDCGAASRCLQRRP